MRLQEIDTRSESPNNSLNDKVVLLTGAAQGLGKAAAVYLAKRGAIIAALDRQDVSTTVAAVEEAGGRCLALQADVSRAHDVDAAFASVSGNSKLIWPRVSRLIWPHPGLGVSRLPLVAASYPFCACRVVLSR